MIDFAVTCVLLKAVEVKEVQAGLIRRGRRRCVMQGTAQRGAAAVPERMPREAAVTLAAGRDLL